jgi:PAS domain S-box-containing protein
VALVGHAFVLALARARATTEAEFQSRLAELLHDFSHDVSAAELNASLEALCNGTNRLFAAARTSVWLHNRRTRMLVLTASSDAGYLSEDRRIPTSELAAPAVNAFRRDRAEIASARTAEPGAPTVTLLVPLKGRRRALGTLVLEAVPLEPATQEELVDRADLLGRQLSGAVENVLLFEGVLRSRRELEQTFDSLADLVAVTDPEGRLVYANRPFVERSGRTRDALIEQPLAEVVGEPTQLLVSRATNGHVERETMSAEVEDPVLRGVFQVTLTPMPGAEPESLGVVFVARDLTSQARLEAERTELRNRLLQSEKLVALGELVAGIAHELNNPLQGVLGHIELLRATGAFPKAIRRDMQRIYREADRAAKIVRNLLVFAGSRRLVRRRTNLNATLSRVLSLRALALRAGRIDVVRHHDDELPRVKGDPLLLQQVLLNIVLNAEQAMGSSGGRLETETSVKLHDGRPHVTVQIRDTGPGLPPAVLPRVFEPFFTTKEVGKGTGLGLAIAYGIMQEHGGQIVASNHQDGGAVFTVRLPAETG